MPGAGSGAVNLQQLNESQYAAVTTMAGPVLVIAGAGSGKTRTLVFRVAHLVEQGVPPESILLLTFTRKASQEILQCVGSRDENLCGNGYCSSVCCMYAIKDDQAFDHVSGIDRLEKAGAGLLLFFFQQGSTGNDNVNQIAHGVLRTVAVAGSTTVT